MSKKKHAGGRPPLPKAERKGALVQTMLTEGERRLLDAIVDARSRERDSAVAGGARVEATRSSVIRELIRQEAERRGLT